MKAYEIQFTGRLAGAIGAFAETTATRFANTPDEAIRLLYEPLPIAFEHVQMPDAREIPSPFGADTLIDYVRNDRMLHQDFVRYMNHLTALVVRVARRAAKANADWHDDPESSDHALFHAPVDQQFPVEVQLEAVAELVLYQLRETPCALQNAEIFNRLMLAPSEKEVAS